MAASPQFYFETEFLQTFSFSFMFPLSGLLYAILSSVVVLLFCLTFPDMTIKLLRTMVAIWIKPQLPCILKYED